MVGSPAIGSIGCGPAGCSAVVVAAAAVAFDCAVAEPVAGLVVRRALVVTPEHLGLSRGFDCCYFAVRVSAPARNSSNPALVNFDWNWTNFGPCFAVGLSAGSKNRCSS